MKIIYYLQKKKNNKKLIFLAVFWLISEVSWNLWAFLFEFQGKNSFILIWIGCIEFFFANVVLGYQIIKNQNLKIFEKEKIKDY